MSGKYKYTITVLIDGAASSANLYAGLAQYAGGSGRTDAVSVSDDRIILECHRTSLIDLDGIFSNYQSGLYSQIAKSIAFYICIKQGIPEITKITVDVERGGKIVRNKTINAVDFKSRSAIQANFQGTFNSASLHVLFEESAKGSALLKAISHFIRAKTKKDTFDRFDSLWKSYNAIYRIIAGESTDHACHVSLRTFILTHPIASRLVVAQLSILTPAELREKLRWRALILNDFESVAKAKAFRDFILRYSDARLMQVFKDILPYRSEFLESAGLLNETETHIERNLNAGTVNDQELTALICIKYMYFVRNKSVHGERLDRIIGLGNKETKEVKWLSDLLEILITDLINANHLYP